MDAAVVKQFLKGNQNPMNYGAPGIEKWLNYGL
jgi:hypothetical protein